MSQSATASNTTEIAANSVSATSSAAASAVLTNPSPTGVKLNNTCLQPPTIITFQPPPFGHDFTDASSSTSTPTPAALGAHSAASVLPAPVRLQYSIHQVPRSLQQELRPIFPELADYDRNGGKVNAVTTSEAEPTHQTAAEFKALPILAIPTFQPASIQLVQMTHEVEHEKNRLLESFVSFAKRMCEYLRTTYGVWADYIDPCSGYPSIGKHGSSIYSEVDSAQILLSYRMEQVGSCCMIDHPQWNFAHYPASILTTASLEQAQKAIHHTQEQLAILTSDHSSATSNHNGAATTSSSHSVLDRFGYIGFDLDHTLARYDLPNFTPYLFGILREHVVKFAGYPARILDIPFNFEALHKALVFDALTGNFLKLSHDLTILVATHGYPQRLLTPTEIRAAYPSGKIEGYDGSRHPRFTTMYTYFEMPAQLLVAIMVECTDRKEVASANPAEPYAHIYPALSAAFNYHLDSAARGDYFPAFFSNPGRFLLKRPQVARWLKSLRAQGKFLFLATNSRLDYTQLLAEYSFGPDWRQLFDLIIADSKKPTWFMKQGTLQNNLPIEPKPFYFPNDQLSADLTRPVASLKDLNVKHATFIHGNAPQLHELFLKLESEKCKNACTSPAQPRVIYFGDHLHADCIATRKYTSWSAGAIVEEVEPFTDVQLSSADDTSSAQSPSSPDSPFRNNNPVKRLARFETFKHLHQKVAVINSIHQSSPEAPFGSFFHHGPAPPRTSAPPPNNVTIAPPQTPATMLAANNASSSANSIVKSPSPDPIADIDVSTITPTWSYWYHILKSQCEEVVGSLSDFMDEAELVSASPPPIDKTCNHLLSLPIPLHHTYFMVRHGESTANVAGIISSDPLISMIEHGLTPVGRNQVETAANVYLRSLPPQQPILIISSDFTRARETAQIILTMLKRDFPQLPLHPSELLLESRLRERYFGRWNGGSHVNYERVWEADAISAEHTENEVESVNSVVKRTTDLISEIETNLPAYIATKSTSSSTTPPIPSPLVNPTTIVLVAHGDVCQILATAFLDMDHRRHRSLPHWTTGELRQLSFKVAAPRLVGIEPNPGPTHSLPTARIHLELIFGYFTLSDLAIQLTVSHEWSQVVVTMPTIHATIERRHLIHTDDDHDESFSNGLNSSHLPAICASTRLNRHISRIGGVPMYDPWRQHLSNCGNSAWEPFILHHPQQLSLIGIGLPHITELVIELDLEVDPITGEPIQTANRVVTGPYIIHLPTSLTSFTISSHMYTATMADLQSILFAATHCSHLVELGLWIGNNDPILEDPNNCFMQLTQMTQLKTFGFSCQPINVSSRLVDEQIQALRGMTFLDQVHIATLDLPYLRRLLKSSHQLQWKELTSLPDHMTDETVDLISSLSQLTKFQAFGCEHLTNFSFLRRLVHLTQLSLTSFGIGMIDDLVTNLSQCTQLRDLNLFESELTCEHLQVLFRHFIALERLHLWGLTTLRSFACFESGPITQSLQSLEIGNSGDPLPPTELNYLLHLRHLRVITVFSFCIEPIPHEFSHKFQTPSNHFPFLTRSSFDRDEDTISIDSASSSPELSSHGTSHTPWTMDKSNDGAIGVTSYSSVDDFDSHGRLVGIETTPALVTAQTLFKDGLHLIYSYLDTAEWSSAFKTCHLWYESAKSTPCRNLIWPLRNTHPYLTILPIPSHFALTHHFTRILSDAYHEAPQFYTDNLISCVKTFTALRILHFQTHDAYFKDLVSPNEISWPKSLVELEVDFNCVNGPNLLQSICEQLHSLTKLHLFSVAYNEPEEDVKFVSPFNDMNQLESLVELSVSWNDYEPKLTHFLSRLPSTITSLNLHRPLDSFLLIPVNQLPHLSCIRVRDLGPGDLRRLHSRYPHLDEILTDRFEESDYQDLALFQLKRIQFEQLGWDLDDSIHRLIDTLKLMNNLTRLRFGQNCKEIMYAHYWTKLGAYLPSLTELAFDRDVYGELIDSLVAFKDRLKKLSLGLDVHRGATLPLTSLSELILLESLIIVLNDDNETHQRQILQFFDSPVVLPQLTYFSCILSGSNDRKPFIYSISDRLRVDSYRLPTKNIASNIPPAAPLVGIELNPGPLASGLSTLSIWCHSSLPQILWIFFFSLVVVASADSNQPHKPDQPPDAPWIPFPLNGRPFRSLPDDHVSTRTPPTRARSFVRIAFAADLDFRPSNGAGGRAVLQLIKRENVDATIISGDLDYFSFDSSLNKQKPHRYASMAMDILDEELGSDHPIFATFGNHEFDSGIAFTPQPDDPSEPTYASAILARMKRLSLDKNCEGWIGGDMVCSYRGLLIVSSGIAVSDEPHLLPLRRQQHEQFMHLSMTTFGPHARWRFCSWHAVAKQFNTGVLPRGPTDNPGYEMYRACINHGGIVATGHEHSYSRSKSLKHISSDGSIIESHTSPYWYPALGDRRELVILSDDSSSPSGMVFVNGLGGMDARGAIHQKLRANWWAKLKNAGFDGWRQPTPFDTGALICDFGKKPSDIDSLEHLIQLYDLPASITTRIDHFVEQSGECVFRNSLGDLVDSFILINIAQVGQHLQSNLRQTNKAAAAAAAANIDHIGADLTRGPIASDYPPILSLRHLARRSKNLLLFTLRDLTGFEWTIKTIILLIIIGGLLTLGGWTYLKRRRRRTQKPMRATV